MAVIISLHIFWAWKLTLATVNLIYIGIIFWQETYLLTIKSIHVVSDQRNFFFVEKNESLIPITITNDSTITRFLMVLRFKFPGERFARSCMIFPDSLTSQDYRRLLVMIRMR